MSNRTLFGAPVYMEQDGIVLPNNGMAGLGAVKTCGGNCGGGRPRARGRSLHGLGANDAADFLNTLQQGAESALDSITGAKAQRDAQAKQLELAQSQVAASAASAAARDATIQQVLPTALAVVGGVVAVGLIALVMKKK